MIVPIVAPSGAIVNIADGGVREMPRKYELRQRAERQAETRRRIIEATVALHQELGVARTTISDIAARSGVERATVYRHFEDEYSLIEACTSHYFGQHPFPDPNRWSDIADPAERLRVALTEVYAYHRATEPMVDKGFRSLPELPVLQEVLAPMLSIWRDIAATLLPPGYGSENDRTQLSAAVGHAINYFTWRSLVREQGLDDRDAATLMIGMILSVSPSDSCEKAASRRSE